MVSIGGLNIVVVCCFLQDDFSDIECQLTY